MLPFIWPLVWRICSKKLWCNACRRIRTLFLLLPSLRTPLQTMAICGVCCNRTLTSTPDGQLQALYLCRDGRRNRDWIVVACVVRARLWRLLVVPMITAVIRPRRSSRVCSLLALAQSTSCTRSFNESHNSTSGTALRARVPLRMRPANRPSLGHRLPFTPYSTLCAARSLNTPNTRLSGHQFRNSSTNGLTSSYHRSSNGFALPVLTPNTDTRPFSTRTTSLKQLDFSCPVSTVPFAPTGK